MGHLINLPLADYFGNCPKCGRNDGHIDIGADHWCFCHKHKYRWWIGSDRFSYMKNPDEKAWKENMKILAGYKEIKPLYRYSKKNMESA